MFVYTFLDLTDRLAGPCRRIVFTADHIPAYVAAINLDLSDRQCKITSVDRLDAHVL